MQIRWGSEELDRLEQKRDRACVRLQRIKASGAHRGLKAARTALAISQEAVVLRWRAEGCPVPLSSSGARQRVQGEGE